MSKYLSSSGVQTLISTIKTKYESYANTKKNEAVSASAITIEKSGDEFTFKQGGTALSTKISFADKVVTAATVVKCVVNMSDGTIREDSTNGTVDCLKLTIANGDPVYVKTSELVNLTNYVQKDGSKVLSTNDYTAADKSKLDGVAASATADSALDDQDIQLAFTAVYSPTQM